MGSKLQDNEGITINSETWNIADGFTKLKILKQIVVADKLETIAIYGVEDIDDHILNPIPVENLPQRRVESLYRLKDMMKQLLSNVSFAIRDEDRPKIEAMRKRLLLIESMIGAISYDAENQVDHQHNLYINEEWFQIILTELQEIKEIINKPINHAGLIFRRSDEMDFDELTKEIIEGG